MASSSKKGTTKTAPLAPLNRRAAGVDIGSTFHVVAVAPELDPEPVRSFRSFTADLTALADWLVSLGIATVAMESTGIYWVPLFEILEVRGLEVVLVNARDAKNVPGRKTDINDAQWIQQLHSYGLLRPSFRVGAQIVALREYLRHRERRLEYAASHVQHMQKALMHGVMKVVTDRQTGLFPGPQQIELKCSCPDWADMCKHVAAVLYGIGARLDQKPGLLFTLHKVDHLDLLSAGTRAPSKVGPIAG